ncbi:HAD hydrolase-like protein [Pectobacterium carotovorum]|uniref:HAD hydrolase-like protein n=1 Tax=Pectobacterium carotovorum TaxID=554 RepID=UPI00057D2820|nr:HAD hydrolase-like protein [Pectobacterium carotovorum]KHT22682.1 haloacid dehalogenase [Pectobacterium carotovorum subsp. carotovorum]MBA0190786.1 HAD hydrolase-like protein [Pectobacterium carotovorum]MBA0201893.1 HAD hydrolase-like protein [Pectobacterium carotovorum]MBB1525165.1 HAD hydrolase-like protein [Pectobacterium carotovorum subsp. carotovorum]MCA6964357.1 HAD hydrolase-like protein [Pectobacterium carotovorum]
MNIIFDLDGTIIDSVPGIKDSLIYAIRKQGHVIDDRTDISSLIGPPMVNIVRTLLEPYGDDRVEETINIYRAHYGQHGLYNSIIYEGIMSALEALKQRGDKLFIATSKRQIFAGKILDDMGISSFFLDIIGTPTDGSMDDKSKLLSYLLTKHGLDQRCSIMVGDRKDDIIGAQDNHLLSIGVLWGYGTFNELSTHQADYLCTQPTELCHVIDKIKSSRSESL